MESEERHNSKELNSARIQNAGNRFDKRIFGSIKLWLRDLLSDYTNVQVIGLWIAAFLTGITAVVYAKLFKFLEISFITSLQNNFWITLCGPPVAFFISSWLVKRFSPEAQGSGIPQVMAAMDLEYHGPHSSFVDKLLSFRVFVVKIFSSLITVMGGGAIGREGPTLQVSASIFHLCGKFVRRYYPKSDEKIWVIAGASAGLASAFNTPLGGIVYAVEEIGKEHFHKVRTVILSSIIISGLVSQWLLGTYLYLGYPKLSNISFSFLLNAIVVGLVTGTLGALFSKALIHLSGISWKRHWLFPIGCGILVSALIYLEPLNAGSGIGSINEILFQSKIADLQLCIGRALASIFSYISGTAGGIFSPALSTGAAMGSLLANSLGSDQGNLMALLGMIGFLTGITHTPFTSFILVLEMTDRHSAIFPMMLTALIAHASAKAICKFSFYEIMKTQYLVQVKESSV